MKFSTFEILKMVETGIIFASEARQMLMIDEHLKPQEAPQPTGEPGPVQDAPKEQEDVSALLPSE